MRPLSRKKRLDLIRDLEESRALLARSCVVIHTEHTSAFLEDCDDDLCVAILSSIRIIRDEEGLLRAMPRD